MIYERMVDEGLIFYSWRCLNCGKITDNPLPLFKL